VHDLDKFKSSTLVACIEDGINAKFEGLVNKFNSGGKMEDIKPEISDLVKQKVESKLKEMDE